MSDTAYEINISDIDLEDQTYNISLSDNHISFLSQSINEAGLITLPVVRPVENQYCVVSGFNTIKACKNNNHSTIRVYKTKKNITRYQCLLISIISLSFQRPLTMVELIICTKRLNEFLDKKQIAAKSNAIFNATLNEKFIADVLKTGTLPDPALSLMAEDLLSFKSAIRLCDLKKDIIQSFLTLFSKLKASQNKQLEMITYVSEICARDNIHPAELLEKKEIKEILDDANKDIVFKTKKIRELLFKKRFPTIFQASQTLQHQINSLNFGNKIKVTPSQNLEDQNFTISFSAKNLKEFYHKMNLLYDESRTKLLKEIFNE